MLHLRPLLMSLLGSALLTGSTSGAPQIVLEDLGSIPGGTNFTATSMSHSGEVIYGSYFNGLVRAFRWTSGAGMQDISVPGFHTFVQDTNADGTVYAGYHDSPAGAVNFLASAGGALQTLPSPPNATLAQVAYLSADGASVVGRYRENNGPLRVFRWTSATGTVALPTPPSGTGNVVPFGISDDGSVVAGYYEPQGQSYRAFVWRSGSGYMTLQLPAAYDSCICYCMSGDGLVGFGRADHSTLGIQSARWDLTTGAISFPTASAPIWDGEIYVTNRDGEVFSGTGPMGQYVRSESTGIVELPSTFGPTFVNAMSADGTVLVGTAYLSAISGERTFRARFPALGHPYCPGSPNSSGSAAQILATGSGETSQGDVTLIARGLPTQSLGYFLTSPNQGLIPNPGGSQGTLCLQAPIGRYVGQGQVQSSGTTGRFELALDLTRHPTPTGFVTVQAGQTWNFTAWYRDSVGGQATSNFTGGLEVDFR